MKLVSFFLLGVFLFSIIVGGCRNVPEQQLNTSESSASIQKAAPSTPAPINQDVKWNKIYKN